MCDRGSCWDWNESWYRQHWCHLRNQYGIIQFPLLIFSVSTNNWMHDWIKWFIAFTSTFQDYTATIFLRQRWRDSRLVFPGNESISVDGRLVSLLWIPDTFIPDSKRSFLHDVTVENRLIRIFSNGTVLYALRYFCLRMLQALTTHFVFSRLWCVDRICDTLQCTRNFKSLCMERDLWTKKMKGCHCEKNNVERRGREWHNCPEFMSCLMTVVINHELALGSTI